MGLFVWAESLVKKMKWYDISLFKLVVFIPGVIVGAYISTFVRTYVWWFVAAFILLDAFLMYKLMKK